jgi:ABC-type transporter Mla subunit MlaD
MFMPPAMTPLALVTPACSPENDPVPADIRAVIDLFTTHLAKVSFPDVDATSLRAQADELRAAAKNVAQAREALAAAIAATDSRLATLTDAASRALAYARVYGDAHPDRQPIVAALAVVARPTASAQTTTSGKRRGRPPKQRESAELFAATPNEAHA